MRRHARRGERETDRSLSERDGRWCLRLSGERRTRTDLRMAAFNPHLYDERLTCFLDDSALDSKSVDHCVLGGVAFNRSGLDAFEEHWTDLMHRFGVEQPFHMRDLSRGQRL